MYSYTQAGNHGHISPIKTLEPFIRKLSAEEYMNLLNGEICKYVFKDKKSIENLCSSKQKCLDRIHANLTPISLFITLTVKENIQDRDLFFYWLNRFTKSKIFRENFGDKFLYTVEKQKRGALHSHLIGFAPLRPWGSVQFSKLIKEWRKIIDGIGSVKVLDIDDPDNIGKYLAKYILKEFASVERYKKVYVPSKGLKQPLKSQIDYKRFKALIEKHKAKEKKAVIDGEEKVVSWYW